MNSHSYRFEIIERKNGMFDKYIDMVYILTLEDSPRRNNYMTQIEKFNIHKTITIQHNKGFKNCKKKLSKQNTVNDLNDAYYHVFLNALQNNYKNIIVFEDDFFFDDTINQYIVDDIGQFITNNPYHLYNLGTTFSISIPNLSVSLSSSLCHLRSYFSLVSHSVIYNRDYVYYYIKQYEKGFKQSNDVLWLNLSIIKYIYYKPLCFQLFERTENSKNWIFSEQVFKMIYFFKLDKNNYPGYHIGNIISYIVSFHIIYILLCFYL